jgi:glycerophosphoryl diester phosphodiesterase
VIRYTRAYLKAGVDGVFADQPDIAKVARDE